MHKTRSICIISGMMLNSVTMFFLDMHVFLLCSGYTIKNKNKYND